MNELTPEKPFKPLNPSAPKEARALKSLLGVINTPEFSTDDGNGPFVPPPVDPMPTAEQQQVVAPKRPAPVAPVAPVPPLNAPQRVLQNRIFTTGRLKAGKDHILKHFGFVIHGFADPLYAVQQYFFGTSDKTVPGARKFLQTLGQWGRGQVDDKYPLSTQRAAFTTIIRGLGMNGHFDKALGVKWQDFGLDPDLWLNAFLTRTVGLDETGRHGVSNVRFQNEYDGLSAAGWTHYHVMCSPATWAKRLKASGLTPSSPEVNDTSESMAAGMDIDAMKRVKLKPQGPKLRVIWNDPEVRSPSPRFLTLNELE